MNFDEVIDAHTKWKDRLFRYIEKPDGSLSPELILDKQTCLFGLWIDSVAAKYKHLPEYRKLVSDHTAFHQQAAIIVSKINHGQNATVNDLTHHDSPYVIAAHNIVTSILGLKRVIGDITIPVPKQRLPAAGITVQVKPAYKSAPSYLNVSSSHPEIPGRVLDASIAAAKKIISLVIRAYGREAPPALENSIREALLLENFELIAPILEASKPPEKP